MISPRSFTYRILCTLLVAISIAGCTSSTQPSAPVATSHTYIVGSFQHGMFRSTDDGVSWKACDSGIANLAGQWVRKLALDSRGNIIAAFNSRGYYKSTDKGLSWSPIALGFQPTDVTLLYASGSTIYTSTVPGYLSRSTDDGLTWASASANLDRTSWDAMLITNSVMVIGSYDGGLWRSTNGGTIWIKPDSSATIGDYQIQALTESNGAFLAGSYTGGIFRSTDLGRSWSNIPHSPDNVQCFYQSGNQLFAGASTLLMRSTDFGSTWKQVFSFPVGTISYRNDIFSIDGEGNTILAISEGGGIVRSTDGGTTWAISNAGLPNTDLFSLVKVP